MTDVAKRQKAMKKYFTYVRKSRECLQKPYPVKFEDEDYISFTNSWSLILTRESYDELEMYDDEVNGKYPEVIEHIRFDGIKKKFDFAKLISEAKDKGYRLSKAEVNDDFKYLLYYDEAYYKIGLIDASFSIIDNGETAILYHPEGPRSPITIKNSIGICMVMPVFYYYNDDPEDYGRMVIELE